jgi:hypothetical protein
VLELQELGLAATVPNTLENELEPLRYAEANKSEAWTQKELFVLLML